MQTVNSNIAMDDFHTLQNYKSYTLYYDIITSYNYVQKIECKQWCAQMADVMNIFPTERILIKIILQLWSQKKDHCNFMHEFHISWTCYYQWTAHS